MGLYISNVKNFREDRESLDSLQESVVFAMNRMPGLFVSDDGAELSSEATIENYKKIAKALTTNFSRNKYDKLIAIGEQLFSRRTNSDTRGETSEVCGDKSFFTRILEQCPSWLKIVLIIALLILIGMGLWKLGGWILALLRK